MSIEVTYGENEATFATRPEHGRPVTFTVTERTVNVARDIGSWRQKRMADRFIVGLKGSDGAGFSTHTSFEAACERALSRARRYDKAYSKPRRVVVPTRQLEAAS